MEGGEAFNLRSSGLRRCTSEPRLRRNTGSSSALRGLVDLGDPPLHPSPPVSTFPHAAPRASRHLHWGVFLFCFGLHGYVLDALVCLCLVSQLFGIASCCICVCVWAWLVLDCFCIGFKVYYRFHCCQTLLMSVNHGG